MKLHRQLGLSAVFCIAAGGMISSGLFVLPGVLVPGVGAGLAGAYFLAGVMVIPTVYSKAELATAMPRSGGTYFFVTRSLGALPGTLAGLADWVAIALKCAFALVGIGAFARLIWPAVMPWQTKAIAVAFCLLFGGLNIASVKATGKAQIWMVIGLLGLLGVFIATGLYAMGAQPWRERLVAMGSEGPGGVLAAAGTVFVSYGGLTKVAGVAEEIRDPGRTIFRGTASAVGVVTVLYVLAVVVTVTVVPAEAFEVGQIASFAPLSAAGERLAGPWGLIALSVAAMLAFVSTANSGTLAASRGPMAMARDGLAPERLGRVSRRFHTPVTSIVLTCSLMIVFIIALDLALLVKVASAMMLMLFALINLSVLIMRSSGIQNYRPLFRSPLYPWMQLAGIVLSIALVVGMGFVPLVATGCFALAGGLWYVVFVRPRFSKDSALLHMVKSAMDSAIRRSDLENELREIALERDEVVHDRFDRLVQRSEILDIPGAMTSADLFRRSAELLAPKVGLSTEDLHARLERREQETTTVVQRGLAIPHVVVPGEDVFELLIVRCRGGVLFPNRDFPVQTAFVLVGSADQRTFHLQALMAIAHIAGEHGFAQRWLRATAHEDLRDILLLSGRSRLHE